MLFPVAGALGQVVKIGKNLVEVTVTGAGTSKEEAIHDAMRKAVERGAGTFIYSQSKTRDFVLVKDTVLARSAGFIQSHKVLSSKQQEDGTWEVKIKAIVSVKGIVDTWGAVTTLLKQMGRPKLWSSFKRRSVIRLFPIQRCKLELNMNYSKVAFYWSIGNS